MSASGSRPATKLQASEVQAALALNPGFTIRRYRAGAQSDNPAFLKGRERIIENMRKAGVPEG